VLSGSRLGVSWMDSRKCQTATASPAEPGELPIGLETPPGQHTWDR